MKRWLLPIFILFSCAVYASENDQIQTGDAKLGWKVFRAKSCMNCHKVGPDSKESIGPDIAKVAGSLTDADLAASMWNHAPQMWEKTSEYAISYEQMSLEETENLFFFISFLRYMEDEGDPNRGRLVLESKSCTACHSLSGKGGGIAPDITSWGQYINPLAWLQKMWQHAPEMLGEMHRRGLAWPTFKGDEMVDLIAYVRDRCAKKEKLYLRTGDPQRGRTLFVNKGCVNCHGNRGHGSNLESTRFSAPTIGMLAGSMWNHAPKMIDLMAAQGIKRPSLSLEELADIVAYLFSVRFTAATGDPKNGGEVFRIKGCAGCHSVPGGEDVPGMRLLKEKTSVPQMAQGLWNHGPNMIEVMREKGISWPNLSGKDMADLISFFKTRRP